jgi:hypothetical protein
MRMPICTEERVKGFGLGLAAAMLATTAAFAGDEVMAPYVGNTLTATDASGRVTRVYYGADHTWAAIGPAGRSRGTWSIQNGDELCVKQSDPRPPENIQAPPCLKLERRKVGDSWTWTPPGAAGPMTLTLTAGH